MTDKENPHHQNPEQPKLDVKIPPIDANLSGMEKAAEIVAVSIGNTLGALIPYPCPYCGKWSPIAAYGGNVVTGNGICPNCGRDVFDPTNRAKVS